MKHSLGPGTLHTVDSWERKLGKLPDNSTAATDLSVGNDSGQFSQPPPTLRESLAPLLEQRSTSLRAHPVLNIVLILVPASAMLLALANATRNPEMASRPGMGLFVGCSWIFAPAVWTIVWRDTGFLLGFSYFPMLSALLFGGIAFLGAYPWYFAVYGGLFLMLKSYDRKMASRE